MNRSFKCDSKFWAAFIISLLFILQMLFNSSVHQNITIYAYRFLNNYYYYNKTIDAYDSVNLSISLSNVRTIFLRNDSDVAKEMCQPNLSDLFVPNNMSHLSINFGGSWSPSSCRSWSSIAVVVPFRLRHDHLNKFLSYMHNFLQCQMNAYRIFVVEQNGNGRFNRAKLMNVGFVEARKIQTFDCYIFHDVDLTPINGRMMYNCSDEGPVHMSSAIDKHDFKMPYGGFFGGVSGFTENQMTRINGFSNRFFGWGGEDDEIAKRISFTGQNVQRYSPEVSKYRMFKHSRDEGNNVNPNRMKILGESKRNWKKDGLNSLNYKIVKIEIMATYTNILTNIDGTP